MLKKKKKMLKNKITKFNLNKKEHLKMCLSTSSLVYLEGRWGEAAQEEDYLHLCGLASDSIIGIC